MGDYGAISEMFSELCQPDLGYSIDKLWNRYRAARIQTENMCAPLQIEDYVIQTCPEVSPIKWHLAHTAWFFETLVLRPFLKGYVEFNPKYATLFNSYYDTISIYHPRSERGLLSRPTVAQVYEYRKYVDENMHELIAQYEHSESEEIARRTILGIHHEQQHQELMLTDLKNLFAYNPLKPSYRELPLSNETCPDLSFIEVKGGLVEIGAQVGSPGFKYDNEYPRHKIYLRDYLIANRPVSNGDFIAFIEDGGYRKSEFWLSDAWKKVKQENWRHPLYWEKCDQQWWLMSLSGFRPVNVNEPVCHVSCYEALAFSRWAGKRLPTEMEWEHLAQKHIPQGNLYEQGFYHPNTIYSDDGISKLYGDVWEWTQSPYSAYPGYNQAFGPMGEYNGKFMSNQMVLRGGSCVTSQSHIRASYRNFFYPHERWQFSGFRLAEDLN